MQAADAVLSNHPAGSTASYSLAQILVQRIMAFFIPFMISLSSASLGAFTLWALGGKEAPPPPPPKPAPKPAPKAAPIRVVDYETLKLVNETLDELQQTRRDLNRMAAKIVFYKKAESVIGFVVFVSVAAAIGYYM